MLSHWPGRGAAIFALLLIPTLAGCSDGPTAGPVTPIGEYELVSRDGATLPIAMLNGDTLISAQMTMRADSTFTTNPTYRNGARLQTNTIAGAWSATGDRLVYRNTVNQFEIATGEFGAGWVTFFQFGSGTYRFERR